eukprot:9670131-Alexandrium_andersonii.AAC.1
MPGLNTIGVEPPPASGPPRQSEDSPANPRHLSAAAQTLVAPVLATRSHRNGPLPACVYLSPVATADPRRRPNFRPK